MSDTKSMAVGTLKQAQALLDETRLRLLTELVAGRVRGEAGASAADLSRRLGIKRQLVNYHLRELEVAGLVAAVAETRRGSATTRVMAATAERYEIDPEILGTVGAEGAGQSAESSSRSRPGLVEDLVDVAFASEADREAFVEDARAELLRLAREYASADGGVRVAVKVSAAREH